MKEFMCMSGEYHHASLQGALPATSRRPPPKNQKNLPCLQRTPYAPSYPKRITAPIGSSTWFDLLPGIPTYVAIHRCRLRRTRGILARKVNSLRQGLLLKYVPTFLIRSSQHTSAPHSKICGAVDWTSTQLTIFNSIIRTVLPNGESCLLPLHFIFLPLPLSRKCQAEFISLLPESLFPFQSQFGFGNRNAEPIFIVGSSLDHRRGGLHSVGYCQRRPPHSGQEDQAYILLV